MQRIGRIVFASQSLFVDGLLTYLGATMKD